MKTNIKTELTENGAKQTRNSVVWTPKMGQFENATNRANIKEAAKHMRFWGQMRTPIDRYPFLSENGVVWTGKKNSPVFWSKNGYELKRSNVNVG